MIKKTAFFGLIILLLSTPSLAETTCKTENCQITITIKIAFMFDQGVDQSLADKWAKEIENKWNEGNWFYGDCQCPVKFKVEVLKGNYSATNNCNPPPTGYHCVIVTDYASKPPKDTGGGTYPGYMYPPGVTNGSSINGWWSNTMSSPDPSNPGNNYFDAAHEAGHMMGLGDDYNKAAGYYGNNLMGNTSGSGASINQGMIDQVVGNVCGSNACPDHCCCGNGVIEGNKGEKCDPMANPTGCGAQEFCCIVCCNCHRPMCIAALGEYTSQGSCLISCTGGQCYYNYKTGCWDCLRGGTVITGTGTDRGPQIANATQLAMLTGVVQNIIDTINKNAGKVPSFIVGMLNNKRINIHVSTEPGEELSAGFMTENSSIVQFIPHPYAEPNMKIYLSQHTILEILESENPEVLILPMLLTGEISFVLPSEEGPDISGPPTVGLSPQIPEPGTVESPPRPEPRGIWGALVYLESISELPGLRLLIQILRWFSE